MALALVVLGNRREAERLSVLLREAGLRPSWEPEAEAVLSRLHQETPQLVVLDGQLRLAGDSNPWNRLRLNPHLLATPLLWIESPAERSLGHGVRVGPRHVLSHPWTVTSVRSVLVQVQSWRASLESRGLRGELELTFPSTTVHLAEVTEQVMGLLEATPLNTDQLRQMRQAFIEMGQNALEWGNRLDPSKHVHVTYRAFDDRVEIVIRDEGPGFDRKRLPHAASSFDPMSHLDVRQSLGLRDGGFGLLIVGGMVDELRYNELGNEVTLTRRHASLARALPLFGS